MTTGVVAVNPIMQFLDNAGNPAVGGSVLTQVGGANYATYSDSALTTALPNPIPLNSRGEASTSAGASSQVFLEPNTVYTFTLSDANGNQLWQATYVDGVQVSITQAAVGEALWPQTAAEITAGVTPTNYAYPPIDVRRYGAVGDGITDDLGAFSNACTVAGVSGGVVTMDPGAKYLLNSGNLIVPGGVTLDGGNRYLGSLLNNSATDIQNLSGILLNSSYSIIFNGGSCAIVGLCIKPEGLTFPLSSTQLANNVYVGTAVQILYDDCLVEDCAIFGFSQAVLTTYPSGSTTGAQRPRIVRLNWDCLSGVQIVNCYDIAILNECHGWPWGTINSTNTSNYTNERSGVGYYMNGVDWPVLDACFCIGFVIGFQVSGRGHARLMACGSDGAVSMSATVNRVSLQIDTGAEYVTAENCVFASAYNAVVLNVTVGTPAFWNYLSNCNIANYVNYGVLVTNGFMSISGCGFNGQTGNATGAFSVATAQSRLRVRNCDFEQVTTLINCTAASTTDYVDMRDIWWDTSGSATAPYTNLSLNYLNSASGVLSLPLSYDYYLLTATQTITTVQGGWPGRELTFVNNSIHTVTWTFGANLLLSGGSNYAMGPNSTLTLVALSNGQWIEKCRG